MAGMENNTFSQNSSLVSPAGGQSAPPPPSEVKVRTMRSDLDAMAKSGGGLPRFQSVKVSGLSAEKDPAITVEKMKSKNGAIVALVVIGLVAALGAIGYLAYRLFFAGK